MTAGAGQNVILGHDDAVRTLSVAAVQTPAADSVLAGLDRATPLVERAAAEGADLVLLPELMAVRYIFTREMWDSAEPANGSTVKWLKASARRLKIWLGTSFLEADGEDFFNTFVLAGPSGEEAGRVRKQTPAMFEPWFFRGESGTRTIKTGLGTIGVGICNDNHRSYLPSVLQRGGADLVLMPHCWPLPIRPTRVVSERDIQRWHEMQTGMAPLYATLLGIPAVFVNKVGPYASPAPAPVRWLRGATQMKFRATRRLPIRTARSRRRCLTRPTASLAVRAGVRAQSGTSASSATSRDEER